MNITRIKEPKISHETARLAHEAGFDKIHVSGFVEWLDDQGNISDTAHELDMIAGKFVTKYKIVNQALLQQWIREEFDMCVVVRSIDFNGIERYEGNVYALLSEYDEYTDILNDKDIFDTYEEATEHALKMALNDIFKYILNK